MAFSIEKYHFKTLSIFDGLTEELSKELIASQIIIKAKKGNEVFLEGTFSKGLYVVQKGKVKIYQTNKEGKEQVVYVYCKDELMGYRPLLCNEPHPVSATTLEESEIEFYPAETFLKVLNKSHELSKQLLLNLSHEFSVWVNKISIFGQKPVRSRIAIALLIFREKYKSGDNDDNVIIDLSRDDLANYIGTTKETLVRLLLDFKQTQVISTKGKQITILNVSDLENIADLS